MNSVRNSLFRRNIFKDCKNYIDNLTSSIPFFIKFVILSNIIFYLLNLFLPISLVLSDIPYYTIYYCNLWRLITTSFMTTDIISILFSIFFWFRDAVKLEREIGTVKYMLIFLMNSFCIHIIYCLITFLVSLIIRNSYILKMKMYQKGVRNEGLWPILLCDLTLLCLSNPLEPQKFFFIPCVIKAKYYPFFLFGLFTIVSGFRVDLEVICGIGFGFLYHYYLRNRLYISNKFSMKIENSFLCRWIKNKKGFINIGGVRIPELKNNLAKVRNVVRISDSNENSESDFKSFKGKGIPVGGRENSDENPNLENKNISSNDYSDGINNTDTESDIEKK